MSYKTILMLFQGESDAQTLLDAATLLAKSQQARLIGFHPEIIPTSFAMASGMPDVQIIQDAAERAAATSTQLKQRFDQHAAQSGLDAAWMQAYGVPGDASAGALPVSRACDLILLMQPKPGGEGIDIDSLLHDAGRPVLVLPRKPLAAGAFDRIVIGWNGSREAARATFDALPFLKAAKAVDLLVVDPQERASGAPQAGETMAASLARHDVPATRIVASSRESSIEQAIVAHTLENGADLLVMGAYGHSWLREFLFGGVTRSILETTPVPTFVSH